MAGKADKVNDESERQSVPSAHVGQQKGREAGMAFDYEDLIVYQKSLDFARLVRRCVEGWDSRYAIKDHFGRAARSIPVNLAAGAMQRSPSAGRTRYDVALGSTFECAACVDIARIYEMLGEEASMKAKGRLVDIARMTFALRQSSERPRIQEDESQYAKDGESAEPLFHHERLKVYQVGLEFTGWVWDVFSANEDLSKGLFRNWILRAPGSS